MSDPIVHIFDHGTCLTQQQLMDYLQDKLGAEERHQLETHLAGCPLCTEALEGLTIVDKKEDIPLIVKQIHKQLRQELQAHHSKNRKVKLYVWLSAVVLVLLIILLLAYFAIHFTLRQEQQSPPAPPHPTAQNLS